MGQRLIGYWTAEPSDGLPHPRDFVDETWDQQERWRVREYLEHGVIAEVYRGLSPCRMCGAHNGHREYTDFTYTWPEGLAHYVSEHAVRLPAEFVEHVISTRDRLQVSELTTDWWKAATRKPQ